MGFAYMCCWAFTERNVVRETFVGWTCICKELCLFINRNRAILREQAEFLHIPVHETFFQLEWFRSQASWLSSHSSSPLDNFGTSTIRAMYWAEARLGALKPLVFALACLAFALLACTVSFLNFHGMSAVWTVPLAVGGNWRHSWKMEQNSCEKWLSWGTLGF